MEKTDIHQGMAAQKYPKEVTNCSKYPPSLQENKCTCHNTKMQPTFCMLINNSKQNMS